MGAISELECRALPCHRWNLVVLMMLVRCLAHKGDRAALACLEPRATGSERCRGATDGSSRNGGSRSSERRRSPPFAIFTSLSGLSCTSVIFSTRRAAQAGLPRWLDWRASSRSPFQLRMANGSSLGGRLPALGAALFYSSTAPLRPYPTPSGACPSSKRAASGSWRSTTVVMVALRAPRANSGSTPMLAPRLTSSALPRRRRKLPYSARVSARASQSLSPASGR